MRVLRKGGIQKEIRVNHAFFHNPFVWLTEPYLVVTPNFLPGFQQPLLRSTFPAKPEFFGTSQYAQKVCALAKGGTVLK